MPSHTTLLKTLGAIAVASIGLVIISGGGAGVGVGGFLLIYGVLVLGALVWA